MSQPAPSIPAWTPPAWLNAGMKSMLRAPLLHRLFSGSTLLITVTGRTSGRRYTTPVGYYRDGNTIIILTRPSRQWWKNVQATPQVELTIARQTVRGIASVLPADEAAIPLLATYLAHRRRDAKAYGVRIGPGGAPDAEDVRALVPHVLAVRVIME